MRSVIVQPSSQSLRVAPQLSRPMRPVRGRICPVVRALNPQDVIAAAPLAMSHMNSAIQWGFAAGAISGGMTAFQTGRPAPRELVESMATSSLLTAAPAALMGVSRAGYELCGAPPGMSFALGIATGLVLYNTLRNRNR